MDDDGLNMRNWGYYEPSFKEHFGLQLMPSMGDTKPFLSPRETPIMVNSNGSAYQHPRNCVVSEAPVPMNYMRDGLMQNDRFLRMLPGNPNFTMLPNTSASHSMIIQPVDLSKDSEMKYSMEDNALVRNDSGGAGGSGGAAATIKKRSASAMTTPKTTKAKKPKKGPSTAKENGNQSGPRAKSVKKNIDVVINGIDMDISGIPIPVCSCTGNPQQCYRWGSGGWQSACCTTTISMHPLPMSTKRRGARIAGRKMSQGAFKKVLEKLASEGYNFANAIDLRTYWAKHGTNKFVTIR